MQLKRLSLVASALIFASSIYGSDDYVSVQYMSYDEDSGRTTIHTPAIEINKNFGTDYTLNLSFMHDSVSGASPTYYDSASGASATIPTGVVYKEDIKYGDIPYEDDRDALSLSLTKRLKSRDELTFGLSYSDENDYRSKELSFEFLHYLDPSKNSSLSFGASYQKNEVGVYCFLNTGECDSTSGASAMVKKDLDVVNLELGYSLILDKTSQMKWSVFMIDEDGYLSNPYMRVVRDYYTAPKIAPDKKPDSRRAYGFTAQYSKALSKKLTSISFYRFYDDDWDITSHTFMQRFFYEVSNKLTLGVGFRGYTQTKAKFFSGRRDYFTDQKYASSDRRVSEFDSYDYTFLSTYSLKKDLDINFGIGYYTQPEYLDATYINVGFKYKF